MKMQRIAVETGERRGIGKYISPRKLQALIYVLVGGLLLGYQLYDPSKRMIEAIVGVVLLLLLWNVSILAALFIVVVTFPIPFAISVGNSNFVFVVIIFIIYLVRVSAGHASFRSDRTFNLPILLLVMAYIISFYNMEFTPYKLRFALIHTSNFFATVLFFYLILNFVDTEEKLERILKVAMITIGIVIVFTFIEMLFPGKTIIPGWLYTIHKRRLIMKGVRMMGPFRDFELLAEFAAINVPIIVFMAVRARRLAVKALYALLMLATLFVLFSTITRGAFVSLAIGMIYMAWLCRRDLNIVRFVSIGAAVAFMVGILETTVARFTISGSLFDRLIKTTFKRGIIPQTRFESWGGAITRALKHPIIGHGPGWDFTVFSDITLWPHNAYLYVLNITGLFGLSAFLLLLYRLFKASLLGRRASLVSSPFPEAFMKILNVCLVIFMIDMLKIDYLRNDTYVYFIWFLFGLIAATKHIIEKQRREQAAPAPPY